MRQAVVLIHGIGDQQPMKTIREFVNAVIEDSKHPDRPKYWNKPDKISELFELRRYQTPETRYRPNTDFYEYYWAHLMKGTTFFQVFRWIWKILWTSPADLSKSVIPIWVITWLLLMTSILFLVKGLLTLDFVINPEWETGRDFIISSISLIVLFFINRIVLTYIGDAARYLSVYSDNISVRQTIRSNGIKLLRDLHTSNRYDRVIVVGHSLGSVIGYDILKHLWIEFNEKHDRPEEVSQKRLERMEIKINANKELKNIKKEKIDEFQKLQRKLWLEQRNLGNPWLVSDFVTLGSPLAHASFLLANSKKDLEDRKRERELPTCPPIIEKNKISYNTQYDVNNLVRSIQILHHAALFAPTRWTNIYFPGDFIGGKLQGIFNWGINDIKVQGKYWISGYLPTSHTKYWVNNPPQKTKKDSKNKKDKLAITALRDALSLESKRWLS